MPPGGNFEMNMGRPVQTSVQVFSRQDGFKCIKGLGIGSYLSAEIETGIVIGAGIICMPDVKNRIGKYL